MEVPRLGNDLCPRVLLVHGGHPDEGVPVGVGVGVGEVHVPPQVVHGQSLRQVDAAAAYEVLGTSLIFFIALLLVLLLPYEHDALLVLVGGRPEDPPLPGVVSDGDGAVGLSSSSVGLGDMELRTPAGGAAAGQHVDLDKENF